MEIPQHNFRAYDIRGLYKTDVTPDLFYKIGVAAGTFTKKHLRGTSLTVGNDIRQSSPALTYAFISGVAATGVHVTFAGTTAFGQTLFKGGELKQDLIAYVTASHLPPEWNGIKFYYGDGIGLMEKDLNQIRDNVLQNSGTLADWKKIGTITTVDAASNYKKFLTKKFHFKKKIRVALDCGGGSMTLSAPDLFTAVGLDMVPVFCEPDPLFSKRPSDPKPKNLTVLVDTVKEKNCMFGVAFDGDGDRAVIVDNTGKVLSADETGILIGKHGLSPKKGTVIVNVECSKAVPEQLTPLGYRVKQIQVGHTYLTLEAKQEHAVLGIESSGHLIIPEYFLFDDAMIIPLKIAEIVEHTGKQLHELVSQIPMYPRHKEEIDCADQIKFQVIEKLKQEFIRDYKKVNTLDGVRVDLDQGWVLIRASNTSPILRLTVEADTDKIADELKRTFQEQTLKTIETIQQKILQK